MKMIIIPFKDEKTLKGELRIKVKSKQELLETPDDVHSSSTIFSRKRQKSVKIWSKVVKFWSKVVKFVHFFPSPTTSNS